MTRRRLAVCMAAITVLAMTAAPAAAQYPPSGPSGAVDSTTVSPGGTVTISGSGWQANSVVQITLFSHGQQLTTVRADGNGTFTTQVQIPSDVSPGQHTVRLSGTGQDGTQRSVDIRLQVQSDAPREDPPRADPPSDGQPPLARTGMSSGVGAAAGIGLLVAGGGALLVARRRQTTQQD